MPNWKKVIVSGSRAAVTQLTASGNLHFFTGSINAVGAITSSRGITIARDASIGQGLTVGGGFGSSGVSITAAGGISANGSLTASTARFPILQVDGNSSGVAIVLGSGANFINNEGVLISKRSDSDSADTDVKSTKYTKADDTEAGFIAFNENDLKVKEHYLLANMDKDLAVKKQYRIQIGGAEDVNDVADFQEARVKIAVPLTASSDISSSGKIFASDAQFGEASVHIDGVGGHVTASGNISASGTIFATRFTGKGGTSIFSSVSVSADVIADNITSTANSGDASIYINSTRPTLGFTDTNSFTDDNDIYLIRGGANILQFQYYDDSASSTTETFNITSAGNATFAGTVTANGTTLTGATDISGKQDTITGAATTIDDSNLTANRAVISNGSGKIAVSDVTSTELGHLDGVTSAVQTQLNAKQATINAGDLGITKIENQAANTVIVRDANSSGALSAKAVTNTQILIGDGAGFTAAALSGDVTMTNGGAVTIEDDAVTGAKIENNPTIAGNLTVNGNTTLGNAAGDTLTIAGNITASRDIRIAAASNLPFSITSNGLSFNPDANGNGVHFEADDANSITYFRGNVEFEVQANKIELGTSANNHVTASGNISSSGDYLGKNITLQAIANDVKPITIDNVDGTRQYEVHIDGNQHTELELFKAGTSKVIFQTYWPSKIDNDAYESKGGLILGNDASITGNAGYGLYVSAGPDSGSIFAPGLISGSTMELQNITASGNITVGGKVTTTEIESTGTLLLDAAADITIDAGGADIILSDDEVIYGTFSKSGNNLQIRSRINNGDMYLRGVDNNTEFDALYLDMSNNGNATFSGTVTANGTTLTGATDISGKQDTITGAATTIDDSNLTVSRAVISNGSGKIAVSDVTSTELGYLDGVTSAVQTQINGKQDTISDGGLAIAKIANQAANTVIVRDANSSGALSAKAVTNTQILIGDGAGFTAAALSGDVTMTNGGAVTIEDDAVTGAKIENNPTIAGNLTVNGTTTLGNATGDTVTIVGNITSSNITGSNIDLSGELDFIASFANLKLNGSAFFTAQSSQIIAQQNIRTNDGKGIGFGVDTDYTITHASTGTGETRLFIKEDTTTRWSFGIGGHLTGSANVNLSLGQGGEFDGPSADITNITSSANISASGHIQSPEIKGAGSGATQLNVQGQITASGTISASGAISGPAGFRIFSKTSTTHGEGQGDICYFGSTTGMSAGRIYHWNSSGAWELANPNAVATSDGLLGVAMGASSAANGVLLRGTVTLDHDPGAVGDVLYLDEQQVSSAYGAATSGAPAGNGDIVRVIGYCLDASNGEIWFDPDKTFVEVTA